MARARRSRQDEGLDEGDDARRRSGGNDGEVVDRTRLGLGLDCGEDGEEGGRR